LEVKFLSNLWDFIIKDLLSFTPKDVLMIIIYALTLLLVSTYLRRKLIKDLRETNRVLGKFIMEYSSSIRLLARMVLGSFTQGTLRHEVEKERKITLIQANSIEELAKGYELKGITIADASGLLIETTEGNKEKGEAEAALIKELIDEVLKVSAGGKHFLIEFLEGELLLMGFIEKPGIYYVAKGSRELLRYDAMETIFKAIEDYITKRYCK